MSAAAETDDAEPTAALCGGRFTVDELATCVKVLQALGTAGGGGGEEYATQHTGGGDPYKPFRAALVPILRHSFSLKLQAKSNAGEKNAKAQERRTRETRRRAQERNLLDSRGLRASRIAKLAAMAESGNGGGLLSIPDGPAAEGGGWSGGGDSGNGDGGGGLLTGCDSGAEDATSNEGGAESPVTLEYSEVPAGFVSLLYSKARSVLISLRRPSCLSLLAQRFEGQDPRPLLLSL
jgi:hypothetical protein